MRLILDGFAHFILWNRHLSLNPHRLCGLLHEFDFQGYQGVLPELDLVDEQDQITHDLNLDDELDDEAYLGK